MITWTELSGGFYLMPEVNNRLEIINLMNRKYDSNVEGLARIREDQIAVRKSFGIAEGFIEDLREMGREAEEKGLKQLPLSPEFLGRVEEFRNVYWPKMISQSRGSITDDRDPWLYLEGAKLDAKDIQSIIARFTYLTSQQGYVLEDLSTDAQLIVNENAQCTIMMTHFNKRDGLEEASVRHQTTQ